MALCRVEAAGSETSPVGKLNLYQNSKHESYDGKLCQDIYLRQPGFRLVTIWTGPIWACSVWEWSNPVLIIYQLHLMHDMVSAGWQMLGYRGTGSAQKVRVFYERKGPQHMLFCRETKYCRDLRAFWKATNGGPPYSLLLKGFQQKSACFQRAFIEPAFGELSENF